MTDEIYELARTLGHVSAGDEQALHALCTQAASELRGRLREDADEAEYGGAFRLAAAWLALAGLCMGSSADGVEGFTAGNLTIRKSAAGDGPRRADGLRKQAEWIMGPYLRDQGFSFLGVEA